MLRARDIMTQDVITISPDTTVEEAAKVLSENQISGVPVVKDNRLVGIVSERDIIMKDKKLSFPDYINILGGIIYLGNLKKFEDEFKKYLSVTVEGLMTSNPKTVGPDATVEEIATLMVEKEINRLPVIDEGRLVGIITRADLVRKMAK